MRYAAFLPLLAVLAAAPALAADGKSPADAEGTWLNPRGTLAVHTDPCGPALCGKVVWASAKAQADARDASVPHLLGTQLLENYRFRGNGVWQGTVFVPDMGRRFSSQIETLSAGRLKVSGCILGGLLCKSQVWTRIGQVPA